jgi:hypothetical protein
MSGESIQKMFEEEKEGDEGWIDWFDNSSMMKKKKSTTVTSLVTQRINWEEKGLKLEGYSY